MPLSVYYFVLEAFCRCCVSVYVWFLWFFFFFFYVNFHTRLQDEILSLLDIFETKRKVLYRGYRRVLLYRGFQQVIFVNLLQCSTKLVEIYFNKNKPLIYMRGFRILRIPSYCLKQVVLALTLDNKFGKLHFCETKERHFS